MAQTAGIVGWNYGSGRVASFTKAINFENLDFSGNDQELFTRLFLNTCLWACRNFRAFGTNSGGRRLAIVRNDNELFDERIRTLFTNMNFFSSVDLVAPWYENHSYPEYYYDLHILIPSYSAFDGVRMPDSRQAFLLEDVYYRSAGMIIAEWFHLLQSIPTKRSFSFQNPSAFNFNKPYTNGLVDLSPLQIERNYLVYTEADEILYSQEVYNDSMSATLPNSFTLFNQNLDTPFKGHIVQIANIKDGSIIFWSTDVPAIGTTTTTTTTTRPPVFDEIKLKIFDLNLINACGPQKLYLTGENQDFFLLEGNELFLTKNIEEPTTLSVNVVAEDYFKTERFNQVLENITIDFVECFAPISLPKDGSGPAFSYRLGGEGTKRVWGQFFPTGVITPFNDYAFIGRGVSDDPTITWVGGQHNDANALWMQVNNGGEITATLTASSEGSYVFNYSNEGSYSIVGDIGKLFLITNDLESNIKPEQHFGSLLEMDYQNQYITELNAVSSDNSNSFSFNVEDPNALDEEGNRIRGDIFLVLYYQKDIIRTEAQDRVFANIYFGQTTTTPPPEFDFTVLIENNIPNTSVDVTSIKFRNIATSSPLPFRRFYLTIAPGLELSGITITDNSDFITTGFRPYSSNSWEIDVTLSQMPIGGGIATIVLSGNTQTTTTTQPPETYPIIVEIFNRLDLVRLGGVDKNESVRLSAQGAENALITLSVGYSTEQGYEYRDFNRPSINIISQSTEGMVSLTGDNAISVQRGTNFNNNGNFNGIVYVPVRVPQLGGNVELDLTLPEPVAVTTTTTTTTAEPCDFSIYIICQQALDCVENANGECVPSNRSTQRLLYSTCCNINDTEIMDKIRQYKNVPSSATLESIYGSFCPSSNFEFLAPCLPKDLDGQCQETLHNEIIDVIPCFFSSNPLP
jgi:hypothetical protein